MKGWISKNVYSPFFALQALMVHCPRAAIVPGAAIHTHVIPQADIIMRYDSQNCQIDPGFSPTAGKTASICAAFREKLVYKAYFGFPSFQPSTRQPRKSWKILDEKAIYLDKVYAIH